MLKKAESSVKSALGDFSQQIRSKKGSKRKALIDEQGCNIKPAVDKKGSDRKSKLKKAAIQPVNKRSNWQKKNKNMLIFRKICLKIHIMT